MLVALPKSVCWLSVIGLSWITGPNIIIIGRFKIVIKPLFLLIAYSISVCIIYLAKSSLLAVFHVNCPVFAIECVVLFLFNQRSAPELIDQGIGPKALTPAQQLSKKVNENIVLLHFICTAFVSK